MVYSLPFVQFIEHLSNPKVNEQPIALHKPHRSMFYKVDICNVLFVESITRAHHEIKVAVIIHGWWNPCIVSVEFLPGHLTIGLTRTVQGVQEVFQSLLLCPLAGDVFRVLLDVLFVHNWKKNQQNSKDMLPVWSVHGCAHQVGQGSIVIRLKPT